MDLPFFFVYFTHRFPFYFRYFLILLVQQSPLLATGLAYWLCTMHAVDVDAVTAIVTLLIVVFGSNKSVISISSETQRKRPVLLVRVEILFGWEKMD